MVCVKTIAITPDGKDSTQPGAGATATEAKTADGGVGVEAVAGEAFAIAVAGIGGNQAEAAPGARARAVAGVEGGEAAAPPGATAVAPAEHINKVSAIPVCLHTPSHRQKAPSDLRRLICRKELFLRSSRSPR